MQPYHRLRMLQTKGDSYVGSSVCIHIQIGPSRRRSSRQGSVHGLPSNLEACAIKRGIGSNILMKMGIEQILHRMGPKCMGTLPITLTEVSATLDLMVTVAHILLSRVVALGTQGYRPSWPVIRILFSSEGLENYMLVYFSTGKMSL